MDDQVKEVLWRCHGFVAAMIANDDTDSDAPMYNLYLMLDAVLLKLHVQEQMRKQGLRMGDDKDRDIEEMH